MVWRINEINGLGFDEYIELKSTLKIVNDDEFKCGKCLNKYEGRTDADEILERNRKRKGCYGVNDLILHKYSDIEYSTCIGNIYSRSALYLIELHHHFKKGVLPFAGSITEQPAKVLEAFSVIEDFNNTELEKRNKQRGHRKNIPRGSRQVRGSHQRSPKVF